MPDPLEGKMILITGGSRGIGRATALRLAKEKPSQIGIVYSNNDEAATQTIADIKSLGVGCSAFRADIGSEDSVCDLFEKVGRQFGTLDIFINNAARGSFQPLSSMSVRSWQKMIDLNARAFLLCAQNSAKLMMDGGKIVGISSLGSHFVAPGYGGLGAAKATMEAMARYLAVELAPLNINVNIVCGGFVDTPSTRKLPNFANVSEEIAARTPEKRIGRPEDLAGVVAFLCSPESNWIRGQTLVVDGGYSLSLSSL
jgi:enoyl-[acyl-carrier protein] reductase III